MINSQTPYVVQVLQRVPPAVCGVGDYSWALAQRMHEVHGTGTSFITADNQGEVHSGQMQFPVVSLPSKEAQCLLDAVDPHNARAEAIILQLSAYGFQKRGIPFWLDSAWWRLSRMGSRPPLITVVHEVAATGPIRSPVFWLGLIQRWLVGRIARHSDAVRTNREEVASWLAQQVGIRKPVDCMPVFSNFGEPPNLPLLRDRPAEMAMFTRPVPKGKTLPQVVEHAVEQCKRLGLTTLHLIGAGRTDNTVSSGVSVKYRGFMEAGEISDLLLRCRVGFSTYNPECLGKSSLLAAFAAHRLAVIILGHSASYPDGLNHGMHLMNADLTSQVVTVNRLQALADNLFDWYSDHNLAANAASLHTQIKAIGH